MGTIGTACQEGTEMLREQVAALLVDVLLDAGVERAYGIWSLEFRELPAFCGMVGKLIIGKIAPGTCHRSTVPVLAIAAQIPSE
jgi:hypothetical protein